MRRMPLRLATVRCLEGVRGSLSTEHSKALLLTYFAFLGFRQSEGQEVQQIVGVQGYRKRGGAEGGRSFTWRSLSV